MSQSEIPYASQLVSFRKDIDDIARGLISAFKLTFTEQEQHLSSPLSRWLDFRLRYIDPRPRGTLKSDGFATRIPIKAVPALNAFIKLSEAGADLNPYQTKTIKQNDFSGTKKQSRTDGLWADWKIHHVHLTDVPLSSSGEFSKRSDWLLFFLAFPEHLALIDVRCHNEPNIFEAHDLVEKAIKNWPEFSEKFQMKGILTQSAPKDAETIKQLRRAGVAMMVEVDGHVYMPPGLGLTTAATPLKVSLQEGRVSQLVHAIVEFFYDPNGAPMKMMAEEGVSEPTFSLRLLLPQGGLAVVYAETGPCWPFSLWPTNSIGPQLEGILLPPWASAKLVEAEMAKKPNLPPSTN